MNNEVETIFSELEDMRNTYFSSDVFNGDIYQRKEADKWSVGEVIYHCYLLLKLTRIVSEVYLPSARLIRRTAGLKPKSYYNEMENIYLGPTMKAPKILEPKMKREFSKGELRLMLERETGRLKTLISRQDDKDIYWIRYPDPVPNFPNVIQTVKLIKIHETHHYKILMERELK